jgi:hypothetical protein
MPLCQSLSTKGGLLRMHLTGPKRRAAAITASLLTLRRCPSRRAGALDFMIDQNVLQLLDGDAPRLDLLLVVDPRVDLGDPEAVRVMRPAEPVEGADLDLNQVLVDVALEPGLVVPGEGDRFMIAARTVGAAYARTSGR